MPVFLNLVLQHSVNEQFAAFDVSKGNVIHDLLNQALNLTSATTPPVTKYVGLAKALSAGAGTIDLTAITDISGVAVGTGVKVQSAIFYNPSANLITIGIGVTNGYDLFGNAAIPSIGPGACLLWFPNAGTPSIDGTHKTLDLTGTLAQVLNCGFCFG